MASYLDNADRLITPRWRNVQLKHITVDQLPSSILSQQNGNIFEGKGLEKKIQDWQDEKNLSHAWELVNAAFISDNYVLAKEAAIYLRAESLQLPANVQRIVGEILGETEPEETPQIIRDESIVSLKRSLGEHIRQTKKRLLHSIRNPFLWLELARLYSSIGKVQKAGNCIRVALQLSGNENRFILRSSSRFYYHLHQFDKAQAIIRQSQNVKGDPLLLSADLNYSLKMGRMPKSIKQALDHVESGRFSPATTSELAATLATSEYKFGAAKNVRRLVRKSLMQPNDNSLAQAEWLSRHTSDIVIDPGMSDIDLAFETRAHESLFTYDFSRALKEGMNWIIDQPFSKRAAHFVSYLCVSLTAQYDMAIEVCEFGLQSNPGAFALMNNLAFAYASVGRVSDAKELMPRLYSLIGNERERIYYLALEGYIHYKEKKSEEGKLYYHKAITLAEQKKEYKLKSRAQAYLVKEQFFACQIGFSAAIIILNSLKHNETDFDVVIQVNAIIDIIEKSKQ